MLNMQKLSKNKSQLIIDKDMTTSLHGVIFIKWWRQWSSTCCPLVSVSTKWHDMKSLTIYNSIDLIFVWFRVSLAKRNSTRKKLTCPLLNTTEQLSDWIHFFRFSSQKTTVWHGKKGRIKQWIIWFSAGFQFCLSYFFLCVSEFRMANVGEWKK